MCIQSTAKIDIGTGISAISARYRATKRFDSNKHSNNRTSVYLKEQNIGAVFRLSSIKPQNLGFEKLVPKIGTNFRPSKKTGLHQFKKTKSWVPKVGSQFPKIGRREKKLKLATRLLEMRIQGQD